MTMDRQPSGQDLADSLRAQQEKTARVARRLDEMTRRNRFLRRQLDAKTSGLETECAEKIEAAKALQMAELIIDNSPVVVFRRLAATDPKGRKMVYVSQNISRFGYSADEFLNGRIMFRDIVYPEDSARTLQEIQTYEREGVEEYTQVYRIVTRSGAVRWIEDRTSVVVDAATGSRYHQGIVIDIHHRKEAEEKLRRSEEKYRRIVATAGEGFLLMDENLRVVDLNKAYCRMVGLPRRKIIGRRLPDMAAETDRHFFSADGQGRTFESSLRAAAGRKVPVLIHAGTLRDDTGATIGTMAFVTDMTENKKALMLAGEVQRSLLPQRPPQMEGIDMHGRNVSCDEVGGDYFDFLANPETPAGPVSVAVGDITGHGVGAALLMTTARAFLRMRAGQAGSLADVVTALNRHLTEDVFDSGRFMTLFYLTIDGARRRIEWIRAGHEPAWLFEPENDRFTALKGPGLALGIDGDCVFRTNRKTDLKKGHVVIVGTDGIWEARNRAGEMFGRHRFREIIRQNAAAGAEAMIDAVFQAHARFTRGVRAEDDVTLAVIRITR